MRFYRVPTNHYTAAYPKPNGPYPVGRIDRLITDPTRRNRYGISTNGSFAITVWYPGSPTAGQRPTRWFDDVMTRDTSSASYWTYFSVTTWLDRLPHLWTYSFGDAPLADVVGVVRIKGDDHVTVAGQSFVYLGVVPPIRCASRAK